MSKASEIRILWKEGIKQIEIAKSLGVPETYVSRVLAPLKKELEQKFPSIVYTALKHYKRTWFKNKEPQKEGKMLDEWKQMEQILKMEGL